jgi:hypothetical protein
MKHISLSIFLLFGSNISFGQSDEFQIIKNVETHFEKRDIGQTLDTINGKFGNHWKNLSQKVKSLAIKYFEERKKDIQADSSKSTILYLTGKENNVVVEINGRKKSFTGLRSRFKTIDYETMDSIYKRVEIGKLERNSGNKTVKIIYPDLMRYLLLEIDTNYSSILIWASTIYPIEKSEDEISANEKTNISTQIPDFIEIMDEELVNIYYEIPKKK